MRRASIALLLALIPASFGSTDAPAASRGWPAGEMVYRPSCFDDADEGVPGGIVGHAVGGSYGAAAPAAPTSSSGPGRPVFKPRPAKKTAPATPPPPPPAPTEDAFAADLDAAPMMEMEEAMPEPEPVELAKDERTRDRREAPPADRPVGPVLDWGATVYLSNDDSMSLASAQRVLYAVMNGMGFSPREVRPHELLNYFSFDAAEPEPDQLFDVLASAEQEGDTLSVALAVKGASPPREPLDLTLVVDRSCSMEEEGRMDYTKKGLRLMQEQLHEGDRVDVVLFDDAVCTPLENFVVGRDDPALLRKTIERMQPRGATDLDLGLKEGYATAGRKRDTHHRNRRMMLLTDALLNTGDVNPATVSDIGRAYDSDGIRLTGVGVGRDFNDTVLDMLTEKGKGAYVYLGSEAVVDRVFGVGFESLTRTIAHDVQFALDLPDSLAMERFYGEEASTVAADVQPIHYYAGTSQVFLQDLRIRDGRARPSDPVTLTVSYRDAATGEPEKRIFRTTVGKMLEADPHNVRKAQALMRWSDLLLARSMGGDACGESLRAYGDAAARVADDAEIGFVNGLVRSTCPGFVVPEPVEPASLVSYKVRVDSDIPIAEVGLVCGGRSWSERLSGSDSVARFEAIPGACVLTLQGAVAMTAKVEVPTSGGDARCLVRGGRLSCG